MIFGQTFNPQAQGGFGGGFNSGFGGGFGNQGMQGGFGLPGGFANQGMQGPSGIMMQGMQMMQMALMMQMMNLLSQMLTMLSGSAAAPGTAAFGGVGGTGSPAGFLGGGGSSPAGGAGATAGPGGVSADAKDAGGGWTNPVGGSYKITSGFGPRKAPTAGASTDHKGIDLAAPIGTPILAAKAGKVSVSKDEATGYGKWIEIQHEDGTKSRYGHLNSRNVQVGAQVAAGQQIGTMGSTGTSTGSHLHFEVFNKQGVQVDPAKAMRL
jgi:murein DD-endopeptidase MepM/ murein hydrolase activator NlpD